MGEPIIGESYRLHGLEFFTAKLNGAVVVVRERSQSNLAGWRVELLPEYTDRWDIPQFWVHEHSLDSIELELPQEVL